MSNGVHPTACVEPGAVLGAGTDVGAHAYVTSCVTTGRDCRIEPGARLGVRGFGYYDDLTDKPHAYGVWLGDRVDVGPNSVICKGSWRDTQLGDDVKIDGLVWIAHNVHVGARTLIVAHAELSGSVTVGSGCWIGPHVAIRERLKIGAGARLGVGAVVLEHVPPGADWWVGVPARRLRS
jgi:UDP-3-O-[3-hydroxymyristoyl] glucosamine N-acyltransferase